MSDKRGKTKTYMKGFFFLFLLCAATKAAKNSCVGMKHKKHNFKLKIALHRLISITTTSTTPSTLAPVGLFQGTKVPNWTCAQ